MITDESDPLSAAQHTTDEPGSFLDVYRSQNLLSLDKDEEFVEKSIQLKVVPESLRYTVMKHRDYEVYRGIIKSTDGSLHYFQWTPNTNFKLIKAADAERIAEATRFYTVCKSGCDLKKIEDPIDSGESIEESTEDKEDKAVQPGLPALPSIPEQEWVDSQNNTATMVHPGSTAAASPDDGQNTQNWHGDATKSLTPPNTPETPPYWSTVDLVKAWTNEIKKSKYVTHLEPLEKQYMEEVLGMSHSDIRKCMSLPPRHKLGFVQWKSQRLHSKLDSLYNWIGKNNNG
jgi:hypothetical protein